MAFKDASTDYLCNARQCKYWGTLLKDLEGCEDISQKLIRASVDRLCRYLSSFHDDRSHKAAIVFEAVVTAVDYGYVSLVPETLFDSIEVLDLLNTLQKYLPVRLEQTVKKEIIGFILSRYPPVVQPKKAFFKAIVDNKQFDVLMLLLQSENVALSRNCLHELALLVISAQKPQIVHLVIQRMKSTFKNEVQVMKALAKNFDEQQLQEFVSYCSPQVKGELINFCFSSCEPNQEKRKLVILTALISGSIDTERIESTNIFKYSIPLLLSSTTILSKLFDAGLSLDTHLRQKAVKLVLAQNRGVEGVQIVCTLLERGAEIESLVEAYSQKGGTVIHAATELALQTKNIEILRLACSRITDTACSIKTDGLKSTPLHVVMRQQTECDKVALEICRILCVELKVDASIKDHEGKTAAEYCADPSDDRLDLLLFSSAKNVHAPQASPNLASTVEQAVNRLEAKTNSKGERRPPEPKGKWKDKGKANIQDKLKLSPQKSDSIRSSTVTSPIHNKSFDLKENDLRDLLTSVLKEDITYFTRKKPRAVQGGKIEQKNDVHECEDTKERVRDRNDRVTDKKKNVKYDVYYSPLVLRFIDEGQPNIVTRTLETIERLAIGESNYVLVRKMYGKLYHSNVDKAKRIIWHKRIAYSPLRRKHCKVLVILDVVLDHDKLDKAIANAKNWIKRGGEEGGTYAVKCIANGFYELPDDSESHVVKVPFMMKDDYGAVPIYSMPEYVLRSIRNTTEGRAKRFGLPLKLSHEEHAVVDMNFEEEAVASLSYHEKTLLVVGRSGTGKTTCCLSRLWEEFLHYWENVNDDQDPVIPRLQLQKVTEKSQSIETENATLKDEIFATTAKDESPGKETSTNALGVTEEATLSSAEALQSTSDEDNDCDHLHQVFVTKSSYLCHEVKRRFFDLISGHDKLWDHFKASEHRPLPSSLHSADVPFPLFITSRNLLMLLDGTLSQDDSFFQRINGKLLDSIRNSEQTYHDENITDILGKDSGEEEDSEDDDSDDDEYEEGNGSDDEDGHTRHERKTGHQQIEITASFFKDKIWKEITQGNPKIDPIFVWQEIKSFIKGSIKALKSEKGFLSKDEYMELGKSKAPNFAHTRDDIYSLFLKYQKYCSNPTHKGQKYFDECDLLFHIFQHRRSLPWIIHNFYIDEVQDFTEAELYLLLSCSQCPNGNFLCGDSAQSIMRGVSFRFTDVRSLFHELSQSFRCRVAIPDRPHYLTVNYRAHTGILRVADSVIELLSRFFKDSFDAIPNQTVPSVKSDLLQKPLLLDYDDPDELPYMLAGNQIGATREIEFGAHQAIIVPTKDTKIPQSLEKAIVLTVLEAKGLEFNDVLLYNFFSESMVDDKSWELVSAYTCVEVEKSTDKITQKYKRVLETFDESEHKTFNTELKCLYTAMTRAKRNLWICDKGGLVENANHPMYEYLLKKELVKTMTLEDSGSGFTSEASTPDEWKKAGDYLMSKHLWDQAKKCYIHAQAESRVYQVHAYIEFQQKHYLESATYFLKADRFDHERKLLTKASLCLRAAKLKDEKLLFETAQLYEKLGKVKWAGEAYLRAKDFENFIRVSETRKRFNRVLKMLSSCGEKLLALRKAVEYRDEQKGNDISIDELAYQCVRMYMSKGDKAAVRQAISYLESPVLKIKYLDRNGFHKDVLEMHAESCNYKEAFEQARKYGLYKRGGEIARKCKGREGIFQELQFLLFEVYANLSRKGLYDSAVQVFESLERIVTRWERKEYSAKIKLTLAQMFLLKAKLFKDTGACKDAIALFKEIKIEGGVMEAVNVLLTCDNTVLSPEEVLRYSLKATRLSRVFGKSSHSLSMLEANRIASYLELNQMQKLLSGLVFVPPHQAYWLPSMRNKNSVPVNEVHRMFQQHLHDCCSTWIESSNAIRKTLSHFRLHKQVKEKGLIPRNAEKPFTEYLTKLSEVVELNEALECFPESQTILTDLFSLLSILHNHAWRHHHLLSLQSHIAIIDSFTAEYNTLLKAQEKNQFNSLDQCMQLWRLSLITKGNTVSLRQSLTETYPQHVFLAWLNSTFLTRKHNPGQVVAFLRAVHYDLLRSIASSPIVFESISDENLLHILILQSLPSIYLLSLACGGERLFVPSIFEFVTENFNILTNQNRHSYSIRKACVLESQECSHYSELADLGRFAVGQLQLLLEFLLHNNSYILSRVIRNGNDTLTRYYMVLILMISLNVIIARPALENESIYRSLIIMVTKLESILNTTSKPRFADYVYMRLKESRHVCDLFSIIQELLHPVKNVDIQQIMPNARGDHLNSLVMKHSDTFPPIQLKQALKPDYVLLQQKTIPQEPSPEVREETELLESEETDISASAMPDEQESTLMSKLKDNMIENNVCKICNVDIDVDPDLKSEKPSDALEQQDSVENSFDKHIACSDHMQKKKEHYGFIMAKVTFYLNEKDVLRKLKQLQESPRLLPEDDIHLTQVEKKISDIHLDVETSTSTESDASWLEITEKINLRKQDLDKILQVLDKDSTHTEDSTAVLIDEDEPLVSPTTEMSHLDLLKQPIDVQLKTKRKRKKT